MWGKIRNLPGIVMCPSHHKEGGGKEIENLMSSLGTKQIWGQPELWDPVSNKIKHSLLVDYLSQNKWFSKFLMKQAIKNKEIEIKEK